MVHVTRAVQGYTGFRDSIAVALRFTAEERKYLYLFETLFIINLIMVVPNIVIMGELTLFFIIYAKFTTTELIQLSELKIFEKTIRLKII